jgi:AraC-like DNA-binding protein
MPRKRWRFCFVMYAVTQKGRGTPLPSQLVKVDPAPLHRALLGLWEETCAAAIPDALDGWARLADFYARQILDGERSHDVRLSELWARVAAAPSYPWTLTELARAVHVGPEQLRRLALQEVRRSPLQQVAHLRMTHAVSLLRAGIKLDAIAGAVGYGTAFSFSIAFKKWSGHAPSAFRVRTD